MSALKATWKNDIIAVVVRRTAAVVAFLQDLELSGTLETIG